MAKIIKKHSRSALVLGLILSLFVSYLSIPSGRAATLANRTVQISDSRPSTSATYDFEADYTASAVKCINIQFCTTASGTCTGAGVGLGTTSKSSSGWAGFTSSQWTLATAANLIALTDATGETPSPETDASYSLDNIVNPSSAATYYARITTTDSTSDCNTATPGGSTVDSGVVAFAVISGVTVSVTVAETLTTSVYAVSSGSCTTTGGTAITSLATSVPFGTVNSDAFYDVCQDVRVATNANSGYSTKVYKTANLTCSDAGLCSSSTISEGNCDGSCSTTSEAAWGTATNNGFGYCMDDTSGNGAETADAGWGTNGCGAGVQNFKLTGTAAANAVAIMSSAAAVSDDRANVGYRISVDASQQAGPYSTTIVYTTTPTY